MENNKVVLKNGETVMDLTGDTVTPAAVAKGVTFHMANGEEAVGVGDYVPNYGKGVNLLDNWYFGNADAIIDQRGGYVVPPDTPYYPDTSLSGRSGAVSEYTTAQYVNSTYGTITVSGAAYYVKFSAMARGYYVNGGYSIDRWKTSGKPVMTFESGYMKLSSKQANYSGIMQIIEANGEKYWGKTLTLSVLGYSENGNIGTFVPYHSRVMLPTSLSCIQHTFTWGSNGESISDPFAVYITADKAIDVAHIIAVKLELGDTQTLAHYDETAQEWVLNDPPPNYQQELAKCQRYYIRFGSNDDFWRSLGVAVARDDQSLRMPLFLSVPMRTMPTISLTGNVLFVGKTVFANSAPPFALLPQGKDQNTLAIEFNSVPDSFAAGDSFTVCLANGNNILELDANL